MMLAKIIQYFRHDIDILNGLVILIIIFQHILAFSYFKPPTTSDNRLNPLLNYVGTRISVEFKGSCLKEDKIIFNHGKIVNIYIVYEINKNLNISSYPTLGNCLFGAVILTKHPDIDQ